MNSTSPGIHDGFPSACVCGSRLSSTRTFQPRASASSTICDPIRPAPPVTSAVVASAIPTLLQRPSYRAGPHIRGMLHVHCVEKRPVHHHPVTEVGTARDQPGELPPAHRQLADPT